MSRKRGLLASLLGIRPATYKTGRMVGDLNAFTRGPTAIGKRLVRKSLWKGFARTLKRLGL